jgi:deazaflavin-dependent oxidoreductase (nitroreductase family)
MSFLHTSLYRATGGRIGGKALGVPVLLLTTIGNKTGKSRTTPVLYMRDGDDLVIVASNAGDDRAPAWWNNLQKTPEATVQVGGGRRTILARAASADDQQRLWPALVKMYPDYETYRKRTRREIPVVILSGR